MHQMLCISSLNKNAKHPISKREEMHRLRTFVLIILAFALVACAPNPYAHNKTIVRHNTGRSSVVEMQRAANPTSAPGTRPGQAMEVPPKSISANNTGKTVPMAKPVINSPVKPGEVDRPENVQAVVRAAGDILRRLSQRQAQKALHELKPDVPTSDNPHEAILEMLIDTTTLDQALKILKALRDAKQE
jgi:hypothetical protein